MVESVPTKWEERERERGEKGGCRESLDFGEEEEEEEESCLNITATADLVDHEEEKANRIFTWQYEPLSLCKYSTPKTQPSLKITKRSI